MQKKHKNLLYLCGDNRAGLLGNGTKAPERELRVLRETLGHEFRQVAIGKNHVLALTVDGHVWSWGQGEAMGHISAKEKPLPERIMKIYEENVQWVATSVTQSLFGTLDGSVWFVGTHKPSAVKRVIVPRPVAELRQSGAIKGACGTFHSVVITETGQTFTWGLGGYRVGYGEGSGIDYPEPQPVESLEGRFMRDVACGEDYTVCVERTGQVWAFGEDEHGALGVGHARPVLVPEEVTFAALAEGEKVMTVAAGRHHTLFSTSAGRVFSCGRGDASLGQGRMVQPDCLRPQLVHGLDGAFVVRVTAGNNHSLARTNDGRVFVWGSNVDATLGPLDSKHWYEEATLCATLNDFDAVHVSAGYLNTALVLERVRGMTEEMAVEVQEVVGEEGNAEYEARIEAQRKAKEEARVQREYERIRREEEAAEQERLRREAEAREAEEEKRMSERELKRKREREIKEIARRAEQRKKELEEEARKLKEANEEAREEARQRSRRGSFDSQRSGASGPRVPTIKELPEFGERARRSEKENRECGGGCSVM